MSWFVVDDKWHSHPKVVGISLAAAGLWARAGSWCNDHLTDGRVPSSLPKSWGATPDVCQELVDAALWVVLERGWQFHDWLTFNPSKEAVLAKRKADADRKARSRSPSPRKRKPSGRSPAGVTPESRPPSPSPSPSPSPNPEESESARPVQHPANDASDDGVPHVRLGLLYKALFDAEQAGSRNPRSYNDQRITSTDAPQFLRLVELVRAESQRSGVGERAVFTVAAQSFLRDSAQQRKGCVLEYFVRDFTTYVDRSLEAAS